MDTFSFVDQYKDADSGQLTVETISDGVAILMILQDA